MLPVHMLSIWLHVFECLTCLWILANAFTFLYDLFTYSGGIELVFNGTNLDVILNPMLEISDPDNLNVINVS